MLIPKLVVRQVVEVVARSKAAPPFSFLVTPGPKAVEVHARVWFDETTCIAPLI